MTQKTNPSYKGIENNITHIKTNMSKSHVWYRKVPEVKYIDKEVAKVLAVIGDSEFSPEQMDAVIGQYLTNGKEAGLIQKLKHITYLQAVTQIMNKFKLIER